MKRTELYKQKGWRWSRLYEVCKVCGSNESPHGGNGECNRCRAKRFYHENREHCIRVTKARDKRRRQAVLTHYGGKCNCCGIDTYEFLSIDHINGGGYRHRKEIGNFGRNFFKWLIKNEYPEGYQVLCHNCNLAKGFYGVCPHNHERQETHYQTT